jgi:adenosylcobinamide-GDP ribazoletransferase
MASYGGAKNEYRHRCARSFAEPHAKVEQRPETQFVEEIPVSGFRRYMGGDGMSQPVGPQPGEGRHRRRADESIDQYGNAALAGGQRSAKERSKLASPQGGGDLQRIAEDPGMMFHREVDHGAFAGKALVIDAGPAASPAQPAAAEQGRRNSGCSRGIADAHFAQTEDIRIGRHGVIAGGDGAEEGLFVHGARAGEVRGRPFEVERDDLQAGARHRRKLVDGGAARGKIRHHLRRHLRRKCRDPLRHHAVISGEHQRFDAAELRGASALPSGKPDGDVLKAAQAAGRLRQCGVAVTGPCRRGGIPGRKNKAGGAQSIKGRKAHHGVSRTLRAPENPTITTACPPILIESAGLERESVMRTHGGWARALANDIRISILTCTRLPLRSPAPIESQDVAHASWAFPIAGALVGAAGALAFWIGSGLRLPPSLAAAVALSATLLATGCLHEDGLADAADGLGGGRDRARKLEIMRDSRLGTYGACALVMSLLLRWAALAAIANPAAVAWALMAAHVFARAALPVFMHAVPPARIDGLSAQAGPPSLRSAAIAALLGVLTLAAVLGLAAGIAGLVLATATGFFVAWLSLRQIGGQTGDVLGALEQAIEVVILVAAAATSGIRP